MSFRGQVLSALRWTAATKLLSQVFTWAITIVVIRVLDPGDYGMLAMATVAVDFLALMAQFGAGAAVVQAQVIDERRLRQMFGFVIAVNCGLFLCCSPARRWSPPSSRNPA